MLDSQWSESCCLKVQKKEKLVRKKHPKTLCTYFMRKETRSTCFSDADSKWLNIYDWLQRLRLILVGLIDNITDILQNEFGFYFLLSIMPALPLTCGVFPWLGWKERPSCLLYSNPLTVRQHCATACRNVNMVNTGGGGGGGGIWINVNYALFVLVHIHLLCKDTSRGETGELHKQEGAVKSVSSKKLIKNWTLRIWMSLKLGIICCQDHPSSLFPPTNYSSLLMTPTHDWYSSGASAQWEILHIVSFSCAL